MYTVGVLDYCVCTGYTQSQYTIQRFLHSPSYVYNVLDFDQLLLVEVSDDSLTSCAVSSQLERITASGTS